MSNRDSRPGQRASRATSLPRLLLRASAAIALGLATPGPAAAHAGLLLAFPGPGLGLAQAPAAVVIKFSEPLNVALSRIAVLDASGTDVGRGPTLAVVGDPNALRRPLGLLPVGPYRVRWTSVSAVDGHTRAGSYSFAVGTPADPATSLADSPLDSEGLLGLIGRFAALVGLGLWLASGLLSSPSRRAGLDPATVGRIGRLAPVVAFSGTLLSVASTSLVATGGLGGIWDVVSSPSGQARLVILAASSAGGMVGGRSALAGRVLAAVAIIAEAASGHAAASVLPPVAIASFAIHLGAVGIWTYAIAASLVAAPSLRRALGTFTPYAVGGAVVVAASGTVNAILELAYPADLVGTGYGLTLVAKSLAFLLMASFGLVHFLGRRRPAIPEAALRAPLRVEATGALLAIVLATLLVGFPNPPREAEVSAASLATSDPVLAELGGRDALSIAAASGPFVVGLTIMPPKPGPAEIRIQVVGVDPGDGLRNARLDASSGQSSFEAALTIACGLGCFAGEARFATAGEWQLEVRLDSNRGPISISESIPLPTADGTAEFTRALGASEALRSALLTESIRGRIDGQAFVSMYRFQAPDRAEITTADSTQIFAGTELFRRTGSGPWSEQPFSPGFTWPLRYFREFWGTGTAARVLGPDTVDGVPTEVIAFLRPDVPAWFRIWIGLSDGLVHKLEMRAEGHIMEQAYSNLNGPITVTVPQP